MARRRGKMSLPDLSVEAVTMGEAAGDVKAVKYEMVDGEVKETFSQHGKCYPLPEQKIYAQQLCNFLNAEIAFDKGQWRVVWTQPRKSFYNRLSGLFHPWVPELMECQYLDKDKDVKCVVEFEEDVWNLLDNFAFTDVAALCNDAYEQMRDLEKITEVRPDQMYSPAHGQREANPTEKIPDLF